MLRIAFRLLAYPTLLYIISIYSHAKYEDPDGFTDLRTAFSIPDVSLDSLFAEKEAEDTIIITDWSDLEYPVSPPKAKTIKPSINPINQDLIHLRQVLYDLSLDCQLLEAKHPQELSSCNMDFPYYERPLNTKLLENARIYTAHIHKFIKTVNNLNSALISTANLKNLPDDIIDFVRDCGLTCLPLAHLLYNQPELPAAEIQAITEEHAKSFNEIDEIIQSSLQKSHENILSSPQFIVTDNTTNAAASVDAKAIHKAALAQLNEHFPYLKKENVIKPDQIDKKSLQQFKENIKNIKFN